MRIARISLLVIAFVLMAGPASAAVKVTKIHGDSPGSDGGSNKSLNAERVVIRNTGSSAVQLKGWTLRDPASHVYRFGSFSLGAGKTVSIHTGDGGNSKLHRYWGQEWYVWNNDGDTAILRRPNGALVDKCTYTASEAAAASC
jgi:hypothetical protein